MDSGAQQAKKAGESDERLFAVAAWREAPYFTDAERAALELAEAVTRLADRPTRCQTNSGSESANTTTRRGSPACSS